MSSSFRWASDHPVIRSSTFERFARPAADLLDNPFGRIGLYMPLAESFDRISRRELGCLRDEGWSRQRSPSARRLNLDPRKRRTTGMKKL
jgi:hypothetical protein